MSDPSINPNEIIVGLARESFAEIAKKFDAQIKRAFQHAVIGMPGGLDRYAGNAIAYYDAVRTIIHRESASLVDVYAPVLLHRAGHAVWDDDFFGDFDSYRRCVIVGSAGSGKSFLLRKLFIDLFRRPHAAIPMFLELRRIDPSTYGSLEDELIGAVSRLGLALEDQTFWDLHQKGRLAIFLDGFDELAPKLRRKIEDDIDRLVQRCGKNWIVVTSRPDTRFSGWSRFSEYQVQPFSSSQVRQLAERTPVPEELKNRFLRALEDGLYESRRDILSIPLFVYVMLMVYEDYSDVPSDITLFYRFAFETLFIKHDASKLGFTRHRHTSLTLDQFERALGAFSFVSFMQNLISFSEAMLMATAGKALHHEQLPVPTDAFIADLMETVCILHRDGQKISFTHRTFQEYFAAHYLLTSGKVDVSKALSAVHESRPNSEVPKFALGISRAVTLGRWLCPLLRTQYDDVIDKAGASPGFADLGYSLNIINGEWFVTCSNRSWKKLLDVLEHVTTWRRVEGTRLPLLIGSQSTQMLREAIHDGDFSPANMASLPEATRKDVAKGRHSFECALRSEDAKWMSVITLLPFIEQEIELALSAAKKLLEEQAQYADSSRELDGLFLLDTE